MSEKNNRGTNVQDIVVLLPGILGSVLERDGRSVWGMNGRVALRNLFTLGRAAEDDLELDSNDDAVVATRLMPDLHLIPGLWKIDGYSRVASALRSKLGGRASENFFEFPYDWRKDNRISAKLLESFVGDKLRLWREKSGNSNAKAILIAHSMGGLVSRYYLEVLGGHKDCRHLITFGTPYLGSMNSLTTLSNGIRKLGVQIKPVTRAARTFPGLYQLLPIYKCLWQENGSLETLENATQLPSSIDLEMLADARKFHREIEEADARDPEADYPISTLTGIAKKTFLTAHLESNGDDIRPSLEFTDTIYGGKGQGGDGTVPRFSADPQKIIERLKPMYVKAEHGSIQNESASIHHVIGALTIPDFNPSTMMHEGEIALDVEDVFLRDEPVQIEAYSDLPMSSVELILLRHASDEPTIKRAMDTIIGQNWSTVFDPLPPGNYSISCKSDTGATSIASFAVLDIGKGELAT